MLKVKPHKTADCVIVGVRWKEKPTRIATLLLGLYNEDGKVDYVGSAAVAASRHKEIFDRIEPLLKDAPERGFSEPNRWGGGELEQSAVRPELVAEVRYDKVQGNRFRHGSKFIRFRDDKDPDQCTWREVRPPRRKDDPRSRVCSAPPTHERDRQEISNSADSHQFAVRAAIVAARKLDDPGADQCEHQHRPRKSRRA